MKRVIYWFRRDLRLRDNTALHEAAQRAEWVIPVFVLEDAFRTGPDVGAARLGFLLQSLQSLREDLATLGYPLLVRAGRAEAVLPRLCEELRAEAVFCNRRYEPYAQARDGRVFNELNRIGVGFEIFKDAVVWEERDLLTGVGSPYTVFTPYARAWRARKIPKPRPALGQTRRKFQAVASDAFSTDPAALGHALRQSVPAAGERAGQDTLNRFLSGPVFTYALRRDFPALDSTSHLSAHLRCGTIGIRDLLHRLARAQARGCSDAGANCEAFRTELIWREFYVQILANFPHVMRGSFRPEYDRIPWVENDQHFQAWCEGQTGYPIVDAAMRCLNTTGWMHNRLRMITAMFLSKDLMLHWQLGERYFMRQLVDGDMAANNGGWQWSAGTGTDAAPYFRIFNPTTQGQRFDPDGAFIRQWVPELAELPPALVHEPWKEPKVARPTGYPKPIVNHQAQRAQCLRLYQPVLRRAPRPGSS